MSKKSPRARRRGAAYHHGDLRAALLRAAEDELVARGTEGFSLRGVARRVGVSHAAPAHHFADTGALLTALAAEGFRRFLATQRAAQARAVPDPQSQLVAAGEGYVAFATAHPALFHLMFASARIDFGDAELVAVARAAFEHLVDGVAAATGVAKAAPVDILAAWAMAHGIADLANSGQIALIAPGPASKATALAALERTLGAMRPRGGPPSED
jgi:AcrR family transcriptional regulator